MEENVGGSVEEHFKESQSLLVGCTEERFPSSRLIEDAIYRNGAARAGNSQHSDSGRQSTPSQRPSSS